jgi:hypothetical protein
MLSKRLDSTNVCCKHLDKVLADNSRSLLPWPALRNGLVPCIAGCTTHVDVNGIAALLHLLTHHVDKESVELREDIGLTDDYILYVMKHQQVMK